MNISMRIAFSGLYYFASAAMHVHFVPPSLFLMEMYIFNRSNTLVGLHKKVLR